MAGDGLRWLAHLGRSFCPYLELELDGRSSKTVAYDPISMTAETDLT